MLTELSAGAIFEHSTIKKYFYSCTMYTFFCYIFRKNEISILIKTMPCKIVYTMQEV